MSAHYVISQFRVFRNSLQWKPYFTYGINEAVSLCFALSFLLGYNTGDVPKDIMSDCELSDNLCGEEHCIHTRWSRILLEKLNGSQLVKKFLAFHGTRRFIVAFASNRHLSLS